MNAERWQEVKAILERAIEIPAPSRARFLDENCPDVDVRREVESMLAFDRTDADVLERSAAESALLNAGCKDDELIGQTVGKYKLVRQLGVGGMGVVFLGERDDGEFTQRVAVKLIRTALNTDVLLQRFLNERQILASLEHPNIARLIDGGTTADGLPFLVMEYVEGLPINEYADSQGFDIEQRLDLFRSVCAAVTFAHQNLVIHRDLKPSNILVTADGTPKLLDFGIAKLLKDDPADQSNTQHVALTPEYASPEQIRGEPLTTATDTYSLGVILYELLTGSRPFRFEGLNIGEIVNTATRSDPVRPSSAVNGERSADEYESEKRGRVTRSLKGDLDNIVLKALKKEPERRYSSVEQLSEDLRRHLKGLPVLARQDTWAYRAEKFTRRNPLVVGSVTLAFLILIGGILATAYQARVANIERAKAEARFKDVRALANSFMFEINEAITQSPVRARELLVQRALEYLDKLANESQGDIELKSELAAAYEKIGEIQSEIFRPFTGKTSEALLSHQKALRLREEVFAIRPSGQHAAGVAISHQNLGNVLMTSGKIGDAREHYRESVRILESQVANEQSNTEVRRHLARSYSMLGQAIVRSGSLGEALVNYQRSLQIFHALSDENPDNDRFRRSVGIVLSYIGFVQMEMDRIDEAAEHYGKWLEIEKLLVGKNPTNVEFRHDLSGAHIWFGVILSDQGKLQQARANFEEGIRIQEEILAADKESVGEAYSLADCHLEFGKAMVRNRLPDLGKTHLEKALAGFRQIWQKDQQNLMTRHRIANAQRYLADAQFQRNDLAQAQENYEQAFLVFKELTEFDPENVDWQQDLAMAYLRRGEFALRKGDRSSAATNFQQALPIFERLVAASPDNIKRRNELETITGLLTKLSA